MRFILGLRQLFWVFCRSRPRLDRFFKAKNALDSWARAAKRSLAGLAAFGSPARAEAPRLGLQRDGITLDFLGFVIWSI